jgi:hypothetical protein
MLMAALATLVPLVALEVVLRMFAPRENVFATSTLDIYAPDAGLGWKLRPNVRRTIEWLERQVLMQTDAEGHRVAAVALNRRAGTPTMLVSGDSYTL